MRIVFKAVTDKGLVRAVNQDSIFSEANEVAGLFCVADGMGGHSRGEFASQTVVEYLSAWWKTFDEDQYEKVFTKMIVSLRKCIEKANAAIRKAIEPKEICGTTLTVIFIYRDIYAAFYAGDSRIYLKRKKDITQISKDETWENRPDNHLSQEEKEAHRNFGKLVNAVGISDNLIVTCRTDAVKPGDIFFLCSDGVYKYCDNDVLLEEMKMLNSKDFDEKANILINHVLEGGAKDNYSFIMVKCEKTGLFK